MAVQQLLSFMALDSTNSSSSKTAKAQAVADAMATHALVPVQQLRRTFLWRHLRSQLQGYLPRHTQARIMQV